jgi:hypothetical protein
MDKLLEKRLDEIIDREIQKLQIGHQKIRALDLLAEQTLLSDKTKICLSVSHDKVDEDIKGCKISFLSAFRTKNLLKYQVCAKRIETEFLERNVSCLNIALKDCKKDQSLESCERRINNHIKIANQTILNNQKEIRSLEKLIKGRSS